MSNDNATIKSARRTLQVFELFAELQRPATVSEIYRRLGLPQSSVSKLLRSFVKLGYMEYDSISRTFVPTLRMAILSGWVQDRWVGETSILRVMESLCRELGTSAILGVQNDTQVLYMLVLGATKKPKPRPVLPVGTLAPICPAAVGKALLMTKSDKEVGLLVRRINSDESDPTRLVNLTALLKDLAECRRRGYALSTGAVIPGVSVIAAPWPLLPGQPQMALGLGTRTDALDNERLEKCVSALHRTLSSPAG
jgi:DNA-binding IclR family transcriptional regulator